MSLFITKFLAAVRCPNEDPTQDRAALAIHGEVLERQLLGGYDLTRAFEGVNEEIQKFLELETDPYFKNCARSKLDLARRALRL